MSPPYKNNRYAHDVNSWAESLCRQWQILRLQQMVRDIDDSEQELKEIRRTLRVLLEREAREEEVRDDTVRELRRAVAFLWEEDFWREVEAERELKGILRARRELNQEEAQENTARERRDSLMLGQGQSVWVGHVRDESTVVVQEAEEGVFLEEGRQDEMNVFEWMEAIEVEADGEEDDESALEEEEDENEDEVSRGLDDMRL